MARKRRRFVQSVCTAGIIGLAGCGGGPSEDDGNGGNGNGNGNGGNGNGNGGNGNGNGNGGNGNGNGNGGNGNGNGGNGNGNGEPSGEEFDIGMVYATGGLGDGSFNDQAQQGLFDAEEDFNVNYDESQPEEVAQFATFQQQYAESTDPDYDLVCCIGFLQTDSLSETAPNYPDQNFMLVDSVVDEPNVANYTFAEHEGSFLVGQLAGTLTTQDFSAGAGSTSGDSTTVGFVGGVESDLIRKFEAGFTAGVNHASDDVDVITNYVGDFDDIAGGREAASAMYDSGADVVYHAAGNTGTGVFQAAQEAERFALGVDRDQSVTVSSYADVILASMVKRVDTAVYTSIENVTNDNHQGGSIVALGLEADGVDIVYGDQIGSEIPSEIQDSIAESRQSIIDGDISVPSTPDDV